jgi:glycosyltransferase involved in cell wall biosynthesis
VVIADRASLPEIAGEAALRIQPDDPAGIAQAVERILVDSGCRASLIERGFEQARRFSWRRTAEQTLAVYRRLLE